MISWDWGWWEEKWLWYYAAGWVQVSGIWSSRRLRISMKYVLVSSVVLAVARGQGSR